MLGDNQKTAFGHDGWDPPDGYGEFRKDGAGGGNKTWFFRFRIPAPADNQLDWGKPARKRVMIVGHPFYMWEHGTYKIPNVPRGVFNVVCLRQNKIDDDCALCKDKHWPSFGAYFTVVDMGLVRYVSSGGAVLHPEPWTDKEGKSRTSQFRRQLMVAKRGGQENPGMLAYFEDQRARRGGDLTGCVFDAMRTGEKKATIGDQWEFVARVGSGQVPSVAEMRAYLLENGATPEVVDAKYVRNDLREETLFTRYTTEDMQALIYPNEEMKRWVGISTPMGTGGRVDGACYDDAPPPGDNDRY